MIDVQRRFAASAILALLVSSAPAQQYLVSTFAGGTLGATAALGANYSIGKITALFTDQFGKTYASSSLNAVFRIEPDGTVVRIAGNGKAGFAGDGGDATDAVLNGPQGLAVDPGGNLYIADQFN